MDKGLANKIAIARQEHAQEHRDRIEGRPVLKEGAGKVLENIVYGANDGIITTFAVIAGVAGADLSRSIVLIMGFANLVADGFSMGMSNYLGAQSRLQYEKAARKKEEWEVLYIPDDERQEVHDIYKARGFTGKLLDSIVDHITSDKQRWVDDMMLWEFGVHPNESESPAKSGITTFIAFNIAGLLPLLPYVFPIDPAWYFPVSIAATAFALFTVGALRSLVTTVEWWRSGLQMLLVGAIAAVAAYGVGAFLKIIIS
ncbi:VIT1/CCC1 transporter family protein [Candidatus Uhrbacteria bacterium]|nr:VIT1/CCC1 transporter family protein [Candidatus Uhrbacteria bacterium]